MACLQKQAVLRTRLKRSHVLHQTGLQLRVKCERDTCIIQEHAAAALISLQQTLPPAHHILHP